MRSEAGFTMIELMVIITIAAILLALAVPSFTESLARRRLEGVTNELNADLQFTRTQAVSNNASVSLVTSAHGYTVSGVTTVSSVASPVTVTYKTITLDSTISLTPSMTVTMDGYRGMSSAATTITVSDSQTSATLEVKVDTVGRIQICAPGVSFGGYVAC